MVLCGRFLFDPENSTPRADWGQKVIWSVHNPTSSYRELFENAFLAWESDSDSKTNNFKKTDGFTCIFAIIKDISEAHDLIIEYFFEFVSSWRWDRRYGSK